MNNQLISNLETKIVERINHLSKRLIELRTFGVKQIGIDEMIHFHYEEIERLCEEKDLDYDPYIQLYKNKAEIWD
jgi:hypothetical protein